MTPRARLYALCLVPVLYTAMAAVRATGASPSALAALVALPVALFAAFRLTEPRTVGEDLVGEAPRAAMRVAFGGAALYAAARSAGVGRAAFDAAAAMGLGASATASLYALARVPEGRGLLEPEPAAKRLDAALSMLLVASIAATVPAVAAFSPRRAGSIDPLTIDYALVAEGFAALLLLSLSSLRMRVVRRLELGVVDRGAAAFVLSTTALAVAAPAAFLGFAAPDRLLPAAGLGSALAVGITLVIPDPTIVGQSLRTVLVVCIFGTPVALFTAGVAATAPRQAGATVLLSSVLLVLVGVLSRRVAARMLPEPARWLRALERAQDAATIPEPYSALRASLGQLRDNLGPSAPSAVLYRSETGDQLSVDRAGYLHEATGHPPDDVFGFCDAEPEHTLRLEVARALEVRRPEIRPTLAWMEAHGFQSVTSLRDEEGAIGLLAMPKARRRSPLTLEEVLALGRLTERIGSVLSLSAALASARQRQLAAEAEARASRDKAFHLGKLLDRQGERYAAHARRLARTSPLGRYSPAARLAEQELALAARAEGPIVLLAPPGVSAESFAAAAHLDSDRRDHPFVVVAGADAREHLLSHWLDELTSPWSLAQRGSLVVLDLPALPHEVQRLLASFLSGAPGPRLPEPENERERDHDHAHDLDHDLDHEQRPGERGAARAAENTPFVIVSVRETVDALVARGRLLEELADALGDRAIPLPPLLARPEDMRAIALEYLTRIGLALRGTPVGLTDDALAQLLEHGFPMNDQELELLLFRAVQAGQGKAVTAADLARVGFEPVPPRPTSAPPPKSALAQAVASTRSTRRRRPLY